MRRREVAIHAAKEAGRVIMDGFGKPHSIKRKGDKEFVSNIDLEAEREIVGLIKREFPWDDILCEETKGGLNKSDFGWIIDALDGTHNYLHNIEIFGTSIAIVYKGRVFCGVIYIPFKDELYMAQKGNGAYLNGERIRVSKRGLDEATLVYDSRLTWNKEIMFQCLDRLMDNVFNVRMFGSTARSLTYLAEGKVDIEIEFDDKIWDFAAGLLLVEEAGGKATDLFGKGWGLETENFVASNGLIHDDLLRIINPQDLFNKNG